MPAPTPHDWTPDAETIASSNLATAMKSVGIDDFEAFHRWSVDDPDGFWALVIDQLGLEFAVPPTAIRGSTDPADPEWLPGASFSIVEACLAGPAHAPAIIHGSDASSTTLSVGELRERVLTFAGGISRAGFGAGARVAIAMPMTVEAVVAYLAIIAAGGVVVSIADSFASSEIATRLDITHVAAVVTQDVNRRGGKVLPMYEKCAAATEAPCIVVDTGAGATLRDQDFWFTELDQGDALDPIEQPAAAHTNILFSSGTTGTPKAIPWTQVTPIKAAMDGRFHHDIHSGDVVAWPTNLGWMMGPWLIYASLLNRAAMALYDDAPTGRGFVEFVDRAGVTMLGLVPSLAAAWRSSGSLTEGDWSKVRTLSSTGEASNADDYRWLMRAAGGVPMIEYCGGTEVGGGYITGTVLQPAIAGRFTTPALGIDIRIVDEDEGTEASSGEVFLVPPSMGLSTELLNRDHGAAYFAGLPELDVPLRRHGDHMERLTDGTIRARGRVDDTMNLGGIKTSSAEIEDAVASVAAVVEVAAVGIPPDDGGPERLVVFVVVAEGAAVDGLRDEMQSAIKEGLNPLFRIHDVVILDALPRTASQKVMRRTLRAEYR